MQARVEMIKAGFRIRYKNWKEFVKNGDNDELIKVLLREDNIENILRLCIAGQQPLLAVVDQIEKYAEENGLVQNGEIDKEWKRNVGRLIGTIVYFIGYEQKEEKSLQSNLKYFKNASNFRKA